MQISELIEKHALPDSYRQTVNDIIQPLTDIVAACYRQRERPVFININGSQGSGKSTLTEFLRMLLEQQQLRVASFSLDDFYLTRAERQQLAKTVHPLLKTRGVPGTHNLPLMQKVMQALLSGESASIPRFDKAIDDQMPESDWLQQPPVDVILFEGWCNGCPVQPEGMLKDPVNALEAEQDPQGVWRHYVNDALKDYHTGVFAKADLMILLQVPGFEAVFEWRRLQEDKLRRNTPASLAAHFMDDEQLVHFIQHYERLTRYALQTLPEGLADILLPINHDHAITGLLQKHDHEYFSATL